MERFLKFEIEHQVIVTTFNYGDSGCGFSRGGSQIDCLLFHHVVLCIVFGRLWSVQCLGQMCGLDLFTAS